MRLLEIERVPNSDSRLTISLREFVDELTVPPYAILSHRWRDDEVSYMDMINPNRKIAQSKRGYSKIHKCCEEALRHNMSYAWVDTCCIDKSSSADLSEAINSMYKWYTQSTDCFAYLDDVENGRDDSSFQNSTWFTRGWTLQELIAPGEVLFFDSSWRLLGSKRDESFSRLVSSACNISEQVLQNPDSKDAYSVSERFSWAASRNVTRAEDEAYSLLGLFNVSMPVLYGEGRLKAFRRLQLEIMQQSIDHTIFAWNNPKARDSMLASSVKDFEDGHKYQQMNSGVYYDTFQSQASKLDYSMTNAGLHIQLPVLSVPMFKHIFFAFLRCTTKGQEKENYVVIFLAANAKRGLNFYYRAAFNNKTTMVLEWSSEFRKASVQTLWIPEWIETLLMSVQQLPSQSLAMDSTLHIKISGDIEADLVQFSDRMKQDGNGPIRGTIPVGDLQHEVISFRNLSQLKHKTHIYIAIGEVSQRLWFAVRSSSTEGHEIPPDHYQFPMGYSWQHDQSPIYFLDEPFTEKPYPFEQRLQAFYGLDIILSTNIFSREPDQKCCFHVKLLRSRKPQKKSFLFR